MAKGTVKNIGASVRQRLRDHARQTRRPFDAVLVRYALERLLYRVSVSPHAKKFALKGAMLLTTWIDASARPTRDVDFLGFGDSSPEAMRKIFAEICAIEATDGIVFDIAGFRTEVIREEIEYGGVRLRTTASLEGARIPIVIDIGFGDAIEPGLEQIDLPVLLDLPVPRLRSYARETVVAEKFHAMVDLGRANTRMKDFYDLWMLDQVFDFDADRLARAIRATFERRKTEIPIEAPDALTPDFANDASKREQWRVYAENVACPTTLDVVVADLARFLMPAAAAAIELDSNKVPPSVSSEP